MRELKIRPVGAITPISEPVMESPEPVKAPVGKITVVGEEVVTEEGFDPLKLSAEDQKMKAVGEIVDDLSFTGGYNKDEKDYLINLAKNPTVDFAKWNDAKLTLGGEHPKQEGQQTYYFDDKTGMPIPLSQSERPPKGKQVESVWGSQASAEDDSILTTIGTNLANTIPKFIESVGDLIHLPYGIVAGKEADWYRDLKNETEMHKARTSTASQKSFLDTTNVETFSDLAKAENWDFTPENVAGNVSSLASTVLQFLGGAGVAKGMGLGAKAIMAVEEAGVTGAEVGIGTKALAKLPYLASSYTSNLATSLEASENAGIEGRERYAIAALVTAPVAAVESFMGLTGKIASNPALKAERDAMVKGLIKGWKEEGGQLTKESLKELYDNTIVASSSVMGQMAKSTLANMAGEASEEVLQNVIQKSSEQIYDKLFAENKEVGKGKYGTEIGSPQAFAEYLNDAVAGALGGGIGGAGVDKYRRAKADLQSENAYDYIKQGPEAVQGLKASVTRAMDNGKITPEQQQQAMFKIDTYQKYYDQVKDLNLDDKSNRRISDLTWSNENLKLQQNALSENPESKIKGTIPHRRLLDTEAILEANSKEMSDLMTQKIADQQTAVAVKVEEKNAENKKEAFKEQAKVSEVVPLKEQIKVAETEKDVDALLAEADKKGIATPELLDAVGKRREEIKMTAPAVQLTPEIQEFHQAMDAELGADKDFNNTAQVDNAPKARAIVKYMDDKGTRVLKGGVIKMGEYAKKVVNGKMLPLYYAVNFGGKEIKFASSEFTNYIKTHNLVDRPVAVQLIKPTDSQEERDALVEKKLLDPHTVVERTDENGNKFMSFVFEGDENKTRFPYVLVAEAITPKGTVVGKIGNLAVKNFKKGSKGTADEGIRSKKPAPSTPVSPPSENIAPEVKTKAGVPFDKASAETDFGAQVETAKPTTIAEEDFGFTATEETESEVRDQLLNKHKLYEDDTENENAVENLPTKDDAKSEPSVADIESKGANAGSSTEAENEQGIKEANALIEEVKSNRYNIKLPFPFNKAVNLDVTTAYDQVLQYFIKGGKVNVAAIEELFGGPGKEKAVESEGKLRKGYVDYGELRRSTDKGVEGLAHTLWESQKVDGQYDSNDFTNAVSDVILEFNNRTEMAAHLNSSFKGKDTRNIDITQERTEDDKSGEGYHGLSETEGTAKSIFLADKDVAEGYAIDSELGTEKYSYSVENPLVVRTDNDFKLVKKLMDEYWKKNPDASFHPDVTNYINTELEKLGYDALIIKAESLESEYGFNNIEGSYGEPQIIIFDRKNVEKIEEQTPPSPHKLDDDEDFPVTPSDNEPHAFQKEKLEPTIETKESRAKKIALLKKAMPSMKVVEDDTIGDDVAGQLDADGKTVRLNPNYNYSDTPIHEFGHAFIDMLGGMKNSLIKKGVDQLRGTKLWKETEARYPELSEDMLAKEVLAEAIGREGVNVFDTKEKQSKFKNWLDGIFYKLKRIFGMEKNIAKSMANQLLSGKRIKGEMVSTKGTQKQKQKEEKTITSSKPLSYNKWAIAQDVDQFKTQERIAEVKDLIEDASGEEKSILEGELELLEQSLDNAKEDYKSYVSDHKNIVEFVASKGDVSKLSLDELYEIQAQMVKYEDIAKTKIYKDLLYNIGAKLNEMQTAEIKAVDPNYNPEVEQKADLDKKDIWAAGLSTIGEKFPAIQAFYKMYRKASGEMNKELSDIQSKGQDLAKKVIAEYHKTHGVGERLKNFTIGGGSKYFSFLAKDGQLIEKGSAEYSKMTKAQKDLLDFITIEKQGLDKHMDMDKNILLKSSAGFIETMGKSGLFKAYANYITNNHNIRNVKIEFKNPETGAVTEEYFGDVENILNAYAKKSHISKVQAMALLTKYNLKARAGLGTTKQGRGKYFLRPDGKLVSMFGGEFKGDFTENYYETFMKYAQDAVFSKNMSPLMPTLTGVEMFYKAMGSDKEQVNKFLNVVKKGKFLGETIESGLGEKTDAALRMLRKWTSWRFIAFNVPANIFNVLVGEYNQLRAEGGKSWAKGKARMAKSMIKGKRNAKAMNILKKYYPDLMTDINRIDPEKHVGRYFDMLAFGGQKLGEGIIRGGAVIGKLSTEHYNWFDNQGNIKGTEAQVKEREAIIKKEIAKYISEVERVQGRYSDVEKRNFAYFELGQFFGQFKVWMPEWLSDRFANTYIDADGVKRTGSFNVLFNYGMRDFIRNASKKEFYTSNKPKDVAMRKQLRGMIITAGLYLAYLSASDDDDDKDVAHQLDKMLKNVSGIYNMDNNTFLLSQPASAMSTVLDLSKMLKSAINMEVIKSGKNKGDFRALNIGFNLLPANKLISAPIDLLSK